MKNACFTVPVVLAALELAVGAAAAPVGQVRYVPGNTVIKARLEGDVSSKSARVGDRFAARLADRDYSGLPEGTRFQGVITEARRSDKGHPGVLDVKIQKAVLPNGTVIPMTGTLASLDSKEVDRTSDGRLESRHAKRGGKFETKWLGYGAAGGAVLSTVFGGNFLKGALLGAAGGAAYAYLNKGKGGHGGYRDVELSQGTRFGIRLNNQLAFRDNSSYHYAVYERDREDQDRDRDDRSRDDRNRDDRNRDDRDRNRDNGDRSQDRNRDSGDRSLDGKR